MRRLYQLVQERAVSFYGICFARRRGQTIRTEVTVEERERTVFCGHALPEGAACPLCGQTLPAAGRQRSSFGAQESTVRRLP